MRKFLLFSSVGVIGFIVDAGVLFALNPYVGLYVGRLFSFLVAVFATFLLNRKFTFSSQSGVVSELSRYISSQSIGAGLNYFAYAIMIFSFNWMEKFPLIALALGSIAGLAVNFMLAKKYVFNGNVMKKDYKASGINTFYIPVSALKLVFFCLSLIIGGWVSLLLEQDVNWDLKNYHIYNAWAFLNNRMEKDILAAGIQTYFNPLLDLPYWMAIERFSGFPRVVAILMGLPAGILLFFVGLSINKVIQAFKFDKYSTFLIVCITAAIGVTGSATLSQWGTTFNEIQGAALVVAGIYLIIAHISQIRSYYLRFLVAGISFGIAAGLKLTALTYSPGAFLAVILLSRSLTVGFFRSIFFCFGCLGGFLISYGWWGYRLYVLTGSPVFPMFNKWLHSPLISAENIMDNRFKPEGIEETLFYPFYWLNPKSMVIAEPLFSDPRFSLAYLAVLLIGLTFIYRYFGKRFSSKGQFSGEVVPREALTLIIWFVVSYVIWQLMFSILRYAVPLEVFTALITLIGFIVITRLFNFSLGHFGGVLFLSLMGLFCIGSTQYPAWGRVSYGKQVMEVENVILPDNSLVVFAGPPIAYLAPFISKVNKGVTFFGIADLLISERGYPLWTSAIKQIRSQVGKIYLIERPEQKHMRNYLSDLGLFINLASCHEYKSSIDPAFTVCELEKM